MVNTHHKYGYGYQPKYKNHAQKLDESLNKITEAQWNRIRTIEHDTEYRFSEYPQDKRGADQFIKDHKSDLIEYYDDVKAKMNELSPDDKRLVKRGVAQEDVELIRKIEKIKGISFSEYRQIRSEAYRFIEENKECIQEGISI